MPDSYIQAWEDELPEHPVVAELRAQPGRWAVISNLTYIELKQSGPPENVQLRSPMRAGLMFGEGQRPPPPMARWLPDPVMAAMKILGGGRRG